MSKIFESVTTRHEVWYLQVEGSEFGPLSPSEVRTILRNGKLKGEVYAWKPGMDQWKRVSEVAELQNLSDEIAKFRMGAGNPGNKRASNRVPFMAVIKYRSAISREQSGICRDISPSGMLIVSNFKELSKGLTLFIHVCPVNANLMDEFETKAAVMRLDATAQSFAVKFQDLDPAIAKRIEGLAKASGK